MQLKVRPAVTTDAAAIAATHAQAWRIGYAGIVPDAYLATIDDAEWETRRRDQLERTFRGTYIFVVLADDEIIGFTHSGPHRLPDRSADPAATVGEIYAIYVHPDHWSAGAGYALMRTAVDHLASDGRAEIRVWVLEENARARRFYERFGFELDGAREAHPIGRGTEMESSPYAVRYTLHIR